MRRNATSPLLLAGAAIVLATVGSAAAATVHAGRIGTITVDGDARGEALDRDHLGRPLPGWQGCRVVAAGDVFLMNWQSEDSLDGRYFGLLPVTTIVGRADPLWTREED